MSYIQNNIFAAAMIIAVTAILSTFAVLVITGKSDKTQLQWEESCLSRGGVVLPVDYGDIGFKCVAP